jgi:regulator of sigma E protease
MAVLILIIGLFLFVSLIVLHEFGHFVVARRNGVVAEEFAIFFGPTIYKRVAKGGWTFKINTIPAGGYVKLKGEHDSDVGPGTYGAASLWVKTKIMSAGVVVNILTGLVLLAILSLIGMPQIIPNQFNIKSNSHTVQRATSAVQINSILGGSPASKSNLKSGDEITGLGNGGQITKINSDAQLQSATKKYAGQKVTIDYTRNNQKLQTSATLNSTSQVDSSTAGHQKVYLGVAIDQTSSGVTLVRNTWTAPIVALGVAKQIIVLTYQGLGHVVSGLGEIIAGTATGNGSARRNAQSSASSQVVGPVGIFVVLKDGSAIGFQFMLFIIAIISLTLGLMNILPIPALDGGRLWLTLASRSIKKPLTAHSEELINAVGILVLFLLLGLITYVDVRRFF